MARYRKIDTRIWNDQKFNELSNDGKLAFFLLLTHPHLTSLGAMRASIPGLASELHWPLDRLKKALAEGFLKKMVYYDETASFIWLPNFLKYNQPESPNVVRSWEQSLDYLPECPLKTALITHINHFMESLSDTFKEALPKAFDKGMPNQEQEQEQEQKISMSGKPDVITPPENDFVFKAHATSLPNQPPPFKNQALDVLHFLNRKTGRVYRPVETNLKLITARLKSGATVEDCHQVIAKKTREWKNDPKMAEYLRPATLFNATKFEQYVGELVASKEDSHDK